MKVLRHGLYGLLILLLVFVAGAAVFVVTFDANRYKSDIESLALKHTGRALKINGEISVTLYPQLGAVITQASLSDPIATSGANNTNAIPAFISLQSTRLSVALLPLLKGEVLVDRIDIEGLNIRLVRTANGALNLQDLLDRLKPSDTKPDSEQSATSTPKKTGTGNKLLLIDIQSVNIKNSGVVFLDEQSQQRWQLSDMALTTDRLASGASGQLLVSGRLQTSSPLERATFEFKSQYQLAPAEPRLTLSNSSAKVSGRWQDFEDVSVEATSVEATSVEATNVKATFGAEADLNATGYQINTIKIEAFAKVNPPSGPTRTLTATLATDQLVLNADQVQGQAIEFSGDTIRGAQRLSTQIALSAWQWQNQALSTDRVGIDVVLTDPSISSAPLHATLAGTVELNQKQPALKSALSGTFNASPLQLAVSVTDFKNPALSFDAHLQTLDLTALTAAARPSGPPANAASPAPENHLGSKSAAIDFSVLHGHQAQGHLRIDTIKTRTSPITALKTAISLANGRLTIGPHQANVWDGQIKGSLMVDADTQSISMAETVSNINIESLLAGLSATDSLSGRGSLTADVTAKGASSEALLKSVSGQVGLQLTDGAVKGVDLQAIMRAARAALGKTSTQADTTDGQTRFTELTATATLKNGVANNQDLRVGAPLFRVQGNGSIDIAAGQLNYLARVTVLDTADAQASAGLKALRGVTVPVRLTGSISKPTYRVDIAALAAELAKTKLNDQVQDRINKAVPGLGDALKGLFGR